MLSLSDLKVVASSPLPLSKKLLAVVGSLADGATVADIRRRAGAAGIRLKPDTNVSQLLKKQARAVIRTDDGWELTAAGHIAVSEITGASPSPAAAEAVSLRAMLVNISDSETKSYAEEAIGCLEHQYFRSGVIMSWVAAFHILKRVVFSGHLAAFNAGMRRIHSNWRDAKTLDDLGAVSEREFLDRSAALGILGKNVKTELVGCLDRRNACGHPNSYKLAANTAAHHVEVLILNVFSVY